MFVRRVFGLLPAFVRYTLALPEIAAGRQTKWFALLREGYENDAGLLEHELTHVRQWYALLGACAALGVLLSAALWLLGGLLLWMAALAVMPGALVMGVYAHGRLYTVSARYRLWAEAAAYREQLRHYPEDDTEDKRRLRFMLFAMFLTLPAYRLSITQDEAEAVMRA